MFILNDFDTKIVFTNNILGKYLVKNGFPLLKKRGNLMGFSKTKALDETINNLPVHIRLLGRIIT